MRGFAPFFLPFFEQLRLLEFRCNLLNNSKINSNYKSKFSKNEKSILNWYDVPYGAFNAGATICRRRI